MIEAVVAISIIGIVIGLLYGYHKQGWQLFNKAFSFGVLEVDARSALEDLAMKIRESSRDMIFVDDVFNPNVPLPRDVILGKPYIYFAKPNVDISDKNHNYVKSYDYYLYYIAKAKTRDDDLSAPQTAKLKCLLIKDQSAKDTENSPWPVLPASAMSTAKVEDMGGIRLSSFSGDLDLQDISPEFSLQESNVFFDFASAESPKNLFHLEVNLINSATKTKVHFETSINPRN